MDDELGRKRQCRSRELYELRPRWQKFLVMLGGPFMNIVLALAIPFTMALIYGVPSNPAPIVGYVKTGRCRRQGGHQGRRPHREL